MSSQSIRWGIIGPGAIAHAFAMAIKNAEGAVLQAVASRNSATAKEFATNYEIPSYYGCYEDLIKDPNVDVVYIATPHIFHKEHSLLCLNAGKHVVCEKPFAMSADEAREMKAAAAKSGVFLMEAMWTRFFPLVVKLREILEQKRIGEIISVQGSFGFKAPFDPDSRLFNKALGGGALYDIGVYVVSMIHMVLGAPNEIEAGADIGITEVDESVNAVFKYGNSTTARMTCSIVNNESDDFIIKGTAGTITLFRHFWKPNRMVVDIFNKGAKEYAFDTEDNAYVYEVNAVTEALIKGNLEHAVMSIDESISILEVMDRIREQCNV